MDDFSLEFGEAPSPQDSVTEILAVPEERKPEIAPEQQPALSMEALTPEQQQQVRDFLPNIDITNSQAVLEYGSKAQAKVAKFSESVLQSVRTKDNGEVGKMLTDLVVNLRGYGEDVAPKGIFGLFRNTQQQVDRMRARYDTVGSNIDRISNMLDSHRRQLVKDVFLFDQLYDQNLAYFRELTLYIVAGQEKLKEIETTLIPEMRQRANGGDQVEAQKLNDLLNQVNRFERKLHDLLLSRQVSLQMGPQIRLVQNNDSNLVDKIQSSMVNAIPLWKNQMVISMGLDNAREALEAQRKVTDMTNELLRRNSEMLKTGTIEIARESERGIIDIETLRKTNDDLIATISEVCRIQQDGREKRIQAESEMLKIEGELKQALITIRDPKQIERGKGNM